MRKGNGLLVDTDGIYTSKKGVEYKQADTPRGRHSGSAVHSMSTGNDTPHISNNVQQDAYQKTVLPTRIEDALSAQICLMTNKRALELQVTVVLGQNRTFPRLPAWRFVHVLGSGWAQTTTSFV